jgi:stage V sporulation protein R
MHDLPDAHTIWTAAKGLGLDLWPVHFEQVPASVMYEFAAYMIPGRMSHWSYGKAFHAMKTRYDYGLSKLYEMVINSNPVYAFLLDTNSPLENVFVMAHVMGHVDFFAHNYCFRHTPEDMLDQAGRHADRVREYQFDHGLAAVESLLDAAFAIQEHVELQSPLLPAREHEEPLVRRRLQDYDDLSHAAPAKETERAVRHQETNPDLVQFLIEESEALDDWQRDVLEMVRSEMQYFWPQVRTKIMNEGWASFWHVRLMRALDLSDDQYVDFARLHSSVLQPMRFQLNPYLVGYRIYEHLLQSSGDGALWLAREVDDDVSFIRNYLTEDLVRELDLYTWGVEGERLTVTSTEWERVRERLVQDLTHGGIPVIHVDDGDYNHRRELYLIHRHEGQDLDLPYAERTLHYVYQLWGRPVHLETRRDGRRVVLSYDGRVNSKVVL